MNPSHRFTLRGDPALERELTELVTEVGALVRAVVPERALVALVLAGGYGRGEGGVALEQGRPRAQNNLDFVLITRGDDGAGWAKELRPRLSALGRSHGLGVDLGQVRDRTLRRAPRLVLWHDMHAAHLTVAGDAAFMPSLRHLGDGPPEADDVRNLLTNRGALLLLNSLILLRGEPTPAQRQTLVRHGMKAILGYGDAWLHSRSAYHVSYVEKRRRMKASDAPTELRALYEEASELRFSPDPQRFASVELGPWNARLLAALAPVHLAFEARRLGVASLRWEDYLPRAATDALWTRCRSPREWPRLLRDRLRSQTHAPLHGRALHLLWPWLAPTTQLSLLFPFAAYDDATLGPGAARLRATAAALLGTEPERGPLARAYARGFGRDVDANFDAAAERMGLSCRLAAPGAAR